METSSKIKSKHFALAFTIGIHAILFLFFLVIEFINPGQLIVSVASAEPINSMGLEISSIQPPEVEKLSFGKLVVIASRNRTDIASRVTDPDEKGLTAKTTMLNEQPEKDLQNALAKLSTSKKFQGDKNAETAEGKIKSTGNDIGNKILPSGIPTAIIVLNGRELIKRPEALTDSKEEGIVVVEIIVDEIGNVIKATPGQRGSTTTSLSLFEKAKQRAIQAKFNSSAEGIKEQRGTYTFVFTLQ